MYNGIML